MTEEQYWIPETELLYLGEDVSIYADGFPVTDGHALVIPHARATYYIDQALTTAMWWGRKLIQEGRCDAFNVGINYGIEAGQTVEWPHVHVIPRRKGDVNNPRGGVRYVIPEKGNYDATHS